MSNDADGPGPERGLREDLGRRRDSLLGLLGLWILGGGLAASGRPDALPPAVYEVAVATVLLLVGSLTILIVKRAVEALLDRPRGRRPRSAVLEAAIATASVLGSAIVGTVAVTRVETAGPHVLASLAILAVLLGYYRAYPAGRYRRGPDRPGVVAIVAIVPGVALALAVFHGAMTFVPREGARHEFVRAGLVALLAAGFHLAASESIRGAARTTRRGRAGLRTVSAAIAGTAAVVAVTTVIAVTGYLPLAPGFGAGADRSTFLFVHWGGFAILAVLLIAVDERLKDEFAWGSAGTRSDRRVVIAGWAVAAASLVVVLAEVALGI